MKKSLYRVLTVVIAATGIWVMNSMAFADEVVPHEFYNQCLTAKIQQCEKKSALFDSWSPKIRRNAMTNSLQASFYKKYRKQLIGNMCAQNVGLKPHQVDYYLIKSFYRSMGHDPLLNVTRNDYFLPGADYTGPDTID